VAQGNGTSPIALVIGSGAIEVVRSLQLAGLPCAVVATPGDATSYSSQVETVFSWDWGRPLEFHDATLADRLAAWGRAQASRPVLFYSSDPALLFTSRHRARLAEGLRFAVPDAELVEAMADKALFSVLAERLALPVPATSVIPPGLGSEPPDLSELGYPLIVKPERRDRGWRHVAADSGAKVKALVVRDEAEMRGLWPELSRAGRPLVAQQYVTGPESAIESYHVYVDADGEIAAEFTGKKIRTYPVECGFTTSLSITDQADVLHLGRKLVELLGLRGIAKFDFKRTPDGQLYLFEINARTSLWMHSGARAGVNIPAAVYADLAGRPRPDLAAHPSPVSWVHPKDVKAARAGGVPLSRWLAFAARAQARAFWYWRDPMPFVGMLAARTRSGDFT
jgi:predicted ATP-grasp superfamily ATP-dependent carboligase